MIEAAIVSVVLLVAAWWISHTLTRIADRNVKILSIQLRDFAERISSFQQTVHLESRALRMELEALTHATSDTHYAELITSLSEALRSEMATIRSRMDSMNGEWFDLSTRVQTNAAHKQLRIP